MSARVEHWKVLSEAQLNNQPIMEHEYNVFTLSEILEENEHTKMLDTDDIEKLKNLSVNEALWANMTDEIKRIAYPLK